MNSEPKKCQAAGCERCVATCCCMSCSEPWLFAFCSEKCWQTVPLVKHLRSEEHTSELQSH